MILCVGVIFIIAAQNERNRLMIESYMYCFTYLYTIPLVCLSVKPYIKACYWIS